MLIIVESSVESDAETSDREVCTIGTIACLTLCVDLAQVL